VELTRNHADEYVLLMRMHRLRCTMHQSHIASPVLPRDCYGLACVVLQSAVEAGAGTVAIDVVSEYEFRQLLKTARVQTKVGRSVRKPRALTPLSGVPGDHSEVLEPAAFLRLLVIVHSERAGTGRAHDALPVRARAHLLRLRRPSSTKRKRQRRLDSCGTTTHIPRR
jgi:hypothetical protein